MRRRSPLALAALLCGCAVGPDYVRPPTPVTGVFRGQDRAEAESFADLPWWEVFRDEKLAALIRDALDGAYTVQAAVARVEQARQVAGISADALLPAITVQATPAYQQVVSPYSIPGSPGNPRFALYQVQGALSWEIDVWGRLRRLREAALADYLGAEEARRGVVVSMVGAVAQNYFQLLALDEQLDVARRTLASRKETLKLFEEQERGGVGTGLQTATQQAAVADAAATIPSIERQIAATENVLTTLIGRPPMAIARTSDLFRGTVPPEPPVGLPAALLERRPDVRQAEAALMAANAQVGAAIAQAFPRLTILANGGTESTSASGLFSAGSTIFGISGLASWLAPVLAGAQIQHQIGAQRANWEALVSSYHQAVLNALGDVASALVAIRTLREQRAQLEIEVKARNDTVKLARLQFRNGVASYLDVTQAEQLLFPAQLQLAQTVGAQFSAYAQLYRALGGGWQHVAAPRGTAPGTGERFTTEDRTTLEGGRR